MSMSQFISLTMHCGRISGLLGTQSGKWRKSLVWSLTTNASAADLGEDADPYVLLWVVDSWDHSSQLIRKSTLRKTVEYLNSMGLLGLSELQASLGIQDVREHRILTIVTDSEVAPMLQRLQQELRRDHDLELQRSGSPYEKFVEFSHQRTTYRFMSDAIKAAGQLDYPDGTLKNAIQELQTPTGCGRLEDTLNIGAFDLY